MVLNVYRMVSVCRKNIFSWHKNIYKKHHYTDNSTNSECKPITYGDNHMKLEVKLEVAKFKEILLHSWDLLPSDKQQELLDMGLIRRRDE
jgi:hypothetical protein